MVSAPRPPAGGRRVERPRHGAGGAAREGQLLRCRTSAIPTSLQVRVTWSPGATGSKSQPGSDAVTSTRGGREARVPHLDDALDDVAAVRAGAAPRDDGVRERRTRDRLLARRVDGLLDRPGVGAVELPRGGAAQLQIDAAGVAGGGARPGRRRPARPLRARGAGVAGRRRGGRGHRGRSGIGGREAIASPASHDRPRRRSLRRVVQPPPPSPPPPPPPSPPPPSPPPSPSSPDEIASSSHRGRRGRAQRAEIEVDVEVTGDRRRRPRRPPSPPVATLCDQRREVRQQLVEQERGGPRLTRDTPRASPAATPRVLRRPGPDTLAQPAPEVGCRLLARRRQLVRPCGGR